METWFYGSRSRLSKVSFLSRSRGSKVSVSEGAVSDFKGLGLGRGGLGLEWSGLGLGLGLEWWGLGLGLGLWGRDSITDQKWPQVPWMSYLYFMLCVSVIDNKDDRILPTHLHVNHGQINEWNWDEKIWVNTVMKTHKCENMGE